MSVNSQQQNYNPHQIFKLILQMPTPKVGLFGTSLILGSKIRKISQLQRAVKNALVDEFK